MLTRFHVNIHKPDTKTRRYGPLIFVCSIYAPNFLNRARNAPGNLLLLNEIINAYFPKGKVMSHHVKNGFQIQNPRLFSFSRINTFAIHLQYSVANTT